MMIKLILCLILLFGKSTYSKEIKKGDAIGTVAQTETPERLKEFPITNLEEHAKTLKPGEIASEKHLITIDPRLISWGLRVTYLGEIRIISGVRREALDMLGGLAQPNNPFSETYVNEILVSSGNEELWLPIQSKVLEYFKSEVKKGDLFQANTRYFGNYFDKKPTQYFLMIDFKQIPKAP
jgi:hypothetical protein